MLSNSVNPNNEPLSPSPVIGADPSSQPYNDSHMATVQDSRQQSGNVSSGGTDDTLTSSATTPELLASNVTESDNTDGSQTVEYSSSGASDTARPSVLLVDDNDVNLKLLVAFTRKARLAYEPVTDGLQALHAYQRAHNDSSRACFTYILMDISMPVMDGMTATREIREFERKNKVKQPVTIIALTGLASEIVQQEAFKSGVNYFLHKPVRFKELLALLKG